MTITGVNFTKRDSYMNFSFSSISIHILIFCKDITPNVMFKGFSYSIHTWTISAHKYLRLFLRGHDSSPYPLAVFLF